MGLLAPALAACATIALVRFPHEAWTVATLTTLAGFSGLTTAFWISGDKRQAFSPSPLDDAGWVDDSGSALTATGYLLCALTVTICLGAGCNYLRPPPWCANGLQMMQVALVMLRRAPRALLPPLGGALAQGFFLFLWLGSTAYIASSGKLEVNEYGFGSSVNSSALRGWSWLHLFGGVWTSGCIAHVSHMVTIDVLKDAYWGQAETKRGDPGLTLLQRLQMPFVHLGSAAMGALACPLVNPFIFWLDLFGFQLRFLESYQASRPRGRLVPAPARCACGVWRVPLVL